MPLLLRIIEVAAVCWLLAFVPASLIASFVVLAQARPDAPRMRVGFSPLTAKSHWLTPLGRRVQLAHRWFLLVGAVLVGVTALTYQLGWTVAGP